MLIKDPAWTRGECLFVKQLSKKWHAALRSITLCDAWRGSEYLSTYLYNRIMMNYFLLTLLQIIDTLNDFSLEHYFCNLII